MASLYPIMNKTKIVHTILPAAISGTTTGATVDTLGFDGVGLVFTVGTVTTADGAGNHFVLTWEHGDASNMSDKAVISTDMLAVQGTFTNMKVAATTGDEVTYTWDYTGGKRYVRAVLTETGTAAGNFAGYIVLSSPRVAPVSN